jgi:hypothetical protein
MFGKELGEQVASDKSQVPMIVTKCISAVEAVGEWILSIGKGLDHLLASALCRTYSIIGMEYEGIYRKTGGSSQSKQITQLFERGDYDAFDLADVETFNDISSVRRISGSCRTRCSRTPSTRALWLRRVSPVYIKHSYLPFLPIPADFTP